MTILNKDLNYVVFTKRAKPISDYDVESTYEKVKNMKYIEISNSHLLDRFRVGVYKKEITVFNLIVEDLDGKIYEDICTGDGKFDGAAFNSKILCLTANHLDILLGIE